MLSIPHVKQRKRRGRGKARTASPTPPAPPVALVLVAATYDYGTSITLTFDRAIDIAGLDGMDIIVDDWPGTASRFRATGAATLIGGGVGVMIDLESIEAIEGPLTVLSATAGNGIVAVDDGGTWAGVTDLPLPFP